MTLLTNFLEHDLVISVGEGLCYDFRAAGISCLGLGSHQHGADIDHLVDSLNAEIPAVQGAGTELAGAPALCPLVDGLQHHVRLVLTCPQTLPGGHPAPGLPVGGGSRSAEPELEQLCGGQTQSDQHRH